MEITKKMIGFLLVGLVLLPGCMSVPTYRAKSLNVLPNDFAYRETKNNVVFRAKRLRSAEIYSLFGMRVEKLAAYVEIIHCSMHNFSNKDYIFSAENKEFQSLSIHDALQLMSTSSAGRLATGVASGIGVSSTTNGLFIIGMCSVFPHFAIAAPYALIFGFPFVAIIGALPFFGKGIKSMVMNERIEKDLQNKMITGDMIVYSGEKYEGLIFVKFSDYKPEFTVTIHEENKESNSITFDVNLDKS